MLRDNNKSEEYFQINTLKIFNSLKEERIALQKNPNVKGIVYYIFSNALCDYITSAYSLGIPANQLVIPCAEMLDAYSKSLDSSVNYSDGGDIIYSELLNMISLGVLLETNEQLTNFGAVLHKLNYHDAIIDFLLTPDSRAHTYDSSLLWPDDEACQKLKEIITSDKSAAEICMKDYLEKYYYTKDNLEDRFNSHKKDNSVYDGYWSFESAAIVKIMGLDDHTFKESPYYPSDMLYEDRSVNRPFTFTAPLTSNEESSHQVINEETISKKKKWWKF